MSLTSFLKQSSDVRTILRETFPLPRHQGAFPALRAQPLTTNFALVGQAFDYLLRFRIQRSNPFAPAQSHWVADAVYAEFEDEKDEYWGHIQQHERAARPFLKKAHGNHQTYLDTGEVTDDLLKSCLDLAAIDGLVRAGEIRGSLGQADPRDLRDLRNLFDLIPDYPFLDANPCLLNPAFLFPSGADCDLLLGSTLIEIKTTKFSEIKLEYFQQLLGYYLLNLDDRKRSCEIEHIGVYFSRHGYLWAISIEELGGKKAFRQFLPLWNAHVDRYHARKSEEVPPAQNLSDLIAQVNHLASVSSYMTWLSRLNNIDFLTWKSYPTSPYFVQGAIAWEEDRRQKQGQRRVVNEAAQ